MARNCNAGQLLPFRKHCQVSAVFLLLTCLPLVAPAVDQVLVLGHHTERTDSLKHGGCLGVLGRGQHELGAFTNRDAFGQLGQVPLQKRCLAAWTQSTSKDGSCLANASHALLWTAGAQDEQESKCYGATTQTPTFLEQWCPAKALGQQKPSGSKLVSNRGRVASASVSFLDWFRNWLTRRQLGLVDQSTDSRQGGWRDGTQGIVSDEVDGECKEYEEPEATDFRDGERSLQDVSGQASESANDGSALEKADPHPFQHEEKLEGKKDEIIESEASLIFRLTHRAKTEDPPSYNPGNDPPAAKGPFASTDHVHLLAADVARRALISSSKISLGGSTVPLGYYFAEIALGTPPQRFTMIVDTGSAIMYVPAKECTNCGRSHESPPYNRAASSTYSPLLCSAAKCTTSTPATCQSPDSPCTYQQHYSEGSSTSGTIAIDVVRLPGILGFPKITFGCQTKETGLLYTQTADGIIGLGQGPGSLIAQLAQQKAVDDAFSLCFGGVEGGGAMVFGSVGTLPGTVWIPMQPRKGLESMYFTEVYGLRVAGSAVRLDSSFLPVVAMVDSGTTYTYLPTELYSPLVAQLLQAVRLPLVKVPKRSLSAACWMKKTANSDASSGFPLMSFIFAGDAVVEIPPENYLFKHPSVAGAVCLGIFSSGQHGATIGGISVHNLLVTYDRAHQLLGFAPLNCSAVADGTLTLPKPKSSFPNLSAPNKTQSSNSSVDSPAYARIPFRNAYHVMNASGLTSQRDSPNPWEATLEGLFFEESSPGEDPPVAPPGSSAPSPSPVESNPSARNQSGTEVGGGGVGGLAPSPSTGQPERPTSLVLHLSALFVLALLARP